MSRARRLGRWARLCVVLGGFAAAAMVPSDGQALSVTGAVIVWFDDITNTANGQSDVCVAISNDFNGDLNGNGSSVDTGVDKNGSGTGNAGKGGGPKICF